MVTIQRVERGNSRFYVVEGDVRVDGLELPSVTTILGIVGKPALIPWANKQGRLAVYEALRPQVGQVLTEELLDQALEQARKRPDKVRDDAADYGTQAHIIIEKLLKGESPEIPEALAPMIQSFRRFLAETDLTVELSERMVYSATHRYAGTIDAVGWRYWTYIKPDGQLDRYPVRVAIDWKTSNGIWPEMALQVAAYARAWSEMTGEMVTEAWIIRFGKDKPEFEAKQVRDVEGAFQAFLAAKTLWETLNGPMFTGGSNGR